MDPAIDLLTLDLVDWLARRERTYEDVICILRRARSRLAVWKQAMRRGFVMTETFNGRCIVKPTELGLIEAELRRGIRRR